MMRYVLGSAVLALVALTTMADGQERSSLGWGRLFNNDGIGDGGDRWRTGGFIVSNLRGHGWDGARPTAFGELLEFRASANLITPDNVSAPDESDRRTVGALSFGVHTYYQRGGYDLTAGLDVIFVGPQTHQDDFQEELHELLGVTIPQLDDFQVENAIYPTLTFELSREVLVLGRARLRPFMELRAGAETYARVGADVTIGRFGEGGLRLRDVATGQRYTGILGGRDRGLSWIAGADIAYVADSRYLDTPGIVAEDIRTRVRSGFQYEWSSGSIFYGATYLSPEFEAQSEGQVLGSLNVRFDF